MTAQIEMVKETGVRRLRLILILGSLTAFGPISLDLYLPALPAIAGEMHTGASLVQLSLTACLLGLSLGQLAAGPLSDSRGRRMPLFAGLLVYIVASFLCVFASSITVLIGLRFIQGMAGGAGIVLAGAAVKDLYSGVRLTQFYSLLMLVNGVVPVAAPIAGGQLLRSVSWQGLFIVLGLVGCAMLIAVFFGLPETLPKNRRTVKGFRPVLHAFRELSGNRSFMGYALSRGLVFAALFAYISGSPFVLEGVFHVSAQTFGFLFAANSIGIVATAQIAGRLAGRIPEAKLFAWGLGIALSGALLLLIAAVSGAGLWPVSIALFLTVSSVGIIAATGFSLAMNGQENAAGSASALLGLMPYVFGSVSAPLAGIWTRDPAVSMGIVIAASIGAAVLCHAGLIGRKKRSPHDDRQTASIN